MQWQLQALAGITSLVVAGACVEAPEVSLSCQGDRDCPQHQVCGEGSLCVDAVPASPAPAEPVKGTPGDEGEADPSEGEGEGDPSEGEGEGESPAFDFPPTNLEVDTLVPAASLSIVCDTSFDTGTRLFADPSCAAGFDAAAVAVELPDGTVALPLAGLTVFSDASLALTGRAPLALVVFGNATVAGALDAGSSSQVRGAGAPDLAECGASAGTRGENDDGGAGGGGGGGFADQGGDGGDGEQAAGGSPGAALATAGLAAARRGGCSGGGGGDGDGGGGAGGLGGGALHLAVSGTLEVSGVISSPGGGGGGGGADGGGGGGGAGGLVRVEAGHLILRTGAAITANGGGGGGGGDDFCLGSDGEDGDDGRPRAATRAAGGAGACLATGGGAGGAGGTGAGASGDDSGQGGGGGGGAAGIIELVGLSCEVAPGALTSPPTSCRAP